MKLKDWDDEEENAGKRKKNSGKKDSQNEEFKDEDFAELDMESSAVETESQNPEADGYEMPLRQRKRGMEQGEEAHNQSGQGLRRKASELKEDPEQEEELAPLPVWAKALIFIGLAVVAALICAVLWHFVHPDKPEEEKQENFAGTLEASRDSSEQSQDSGSALGSEDEAGTESDPSSGSVPNSNLGSETPIESETGSDIDMETVPKEETPDEKPQPSDNPDAVPTEPSDTQLPDQSQSMEQSGTAEQFGAGMQESGAEDMRMTFTDVQESVTPKDAVNLRTMPTTTDDRNIVAKIRNGEALARTGINVNTGWSRIDYNGQTLYAVSQYLTTDLNYKTPVTPSDPNWVTTAGGSVIIFENCDDWITPKEYVNLRTEPSTVQGEATVSCQLNNGENAHRTGYSADFGWSRVEYNGQILYVVTSFVNVVAAE